MFLSQLIVNTAGNPDQPRPGRDWVRQIYRVHQRIWMAFPDEHKRKADPFFLGEWSAPDSRKPRRTEAGFLFRVEPDLPTRVLVQSVLKPDWDYAFQNARHFLAETPEVREFNPELVQGSIYRFRLTMLMVKRRTLKEGETRSTTEHPIRCLIPSTNPGDPPVLDPKFTAWREKLKTEGLSHGFEPGIYPQKLSVAPVRNLLMKPESNGKSKPFNAAMFEGELICTDVAKLKSAILNGIGRGKAFGMGLLSLAKAKA